MPNWLERYQRGEYSEVWQEMVALDSLIYGSPLYEEGERVARETMRRARFNIERLLVNFPKIGYILGHTFRPTLDDPSISRAFTTAYDGPFADELRSIQQESRIEVGGYSFKPEVFCPHTSQTDQYLQFLEHAFGPLPLSFKAWYQTINEVNLTGHLGKYYQILEPAPVFHLDNDPLYIVGLEKIFCPKLWPEQKRFDRDGNEIILYLAPYYDYKNAENDGEGYAIRLPCQGADFPFFNEWHQTTFVEYLRNCFRWGGLPGLAYHKVPSYIIETLTEDLLPL